MNNAYVVEKEFFSSYDSDGGSIEILGIYQTQEDAEKAIKIYQEYLESNFPEIQYSYSYEIKENRLNNFNPNFM
jgi:hypothetical protein